jgi:hypothetical protein
MESPLTIEVLDGQMAICRLPKDAPIPEWLDLEQFHSITRTREELSIVCSENCVPGDTACERDWRLLKVVGPLYFALTGILASLVTPLAKAGISVFSISTFDTDYLLVKSDRLDETVGTLGGFCTIDIK